MIIDDVENHHFGLFGQFTMLAECTWRTPDGEKWTPQKVINSAAPRISDRWAWSQIHCWKIEGRLKVKHVELPRRLGLHKPYDPVWEFINEKFGPGTREPHATIGRADLCCDGGEDRPSLMVEFGLCPPIKFTMNLGLSGYHQHWMIVPYECRYAFVFIPLAWPLLPLGGRRTSKQTQERVSKDEEAKKALEALRRNG